MTMRSSYRRSSGFYNNYLMSKEDRDKYFAAFVKNDVGVFSYMKTPQSADVLGGTADGRSTLNAITLLGRRYDTLADDLSQWAGNCADGGKLVFQKPADRTAFQEKKYAEYFKLYLSALLQLVTAKGVGEDGLPKPDQWTNVNTLSLKMLEKVNELSCESAKVVAANWKNLPQRYKGDVCVLKSREEVTNQIQRYYAKR